MSDLQTFTKATLEKQAADSSANINNLQQRVQQLTEAIQQEKGILLYTQHLLKNFELPVEIPKVPTEVA